MIRRTSPTYHFHVCFGISLFFSVIRGKIILEAYDLSSLENNMIVVKILDAAKQSARTGQKVMIKNEE